MKRLLSFTGLAFATCVLSFVGTASAQIAWGPGVDLFGGGDNQDFVSDLGTSVLAINGTDVGNAASAMGPLSSTIVNGVDFVGVSGADVNAGFTQNGVTFSTAVSPGNNQGAFENDTNAVSGFTDTGVQALISGGFFNFGDSAVTFSGLTVGDTYEIQIFVNDSRASRGGANTAIFSDGVNDTVTSLANGTAGLAELNNIVDNTVNPDSAVGDNSGDSVTGTFTVTAPDEGLTTGSQSFQIAGTTNINPDAGNAVAFSPSPSSIQALQLRNITNATGCTNGELGDVNTDGIVNFLDISPFIMVLASPAFQCEADINEDGVVDFLDISPFIVILSSS